jgi:hypothetical protein
VMQQVPALQVNQRVMPKRPPQRPTKTNTH